MLIGWFPLNNNLNNQGIENWTVTSSGITYDTGKVTNKSAIFDADTDYIKVEGLNQLNSLKQYSFSCWVYINALSTYDRHASAFLSSGDWNTPGGHFVFGVYNYNNGFRRILVPNTVNCYSGINLAQEDAIQLNTWYNITITFDGEFTRGYINGKYVGRCTGCKIPSTNVSYFYMGAATYYNGFTIKGKLNDVRIYDHALSLTEIKKLAQGLACHFTFNFEDFYTPVDYLESDGNQYINTGFTKPTAASTDTFIIEANVSSTNIANGSRKFMFGFNNPTRSHYADFDATGHYGAFDCYSTAAFSSYTIYPVKMKINGGSSTNYYINGTLTSTDTTYQGLEWGTFNLFCLDTSYMGNTIRIYSAKMYYNGELVRDYMPCVRKTDNKPGFYDWVTNTFYSKTGSGDFKAPYYAAVEYIQSNGSQYIDTNFTANQDTRIEVKFNSQITTIGQEFVFGSRVLYDNSGISFCPNFNNKYFAQYKNTFVSTGPDYITNQDITINMDKNNVYINNIQYYTFEYSNFTTPGSMLLFACRSTNQGGIIGYSNIKMYYCKIWNNGVLERDFIPVVNLLTNEAGLYDNVEGKFYSNIGSGSFSAPSVANTHMVDCSGYLVDGVGSNITESKDTAWGNSCAVFNGSDSYIQINQPTFLTSAITINVWAYKEDWTTNTSERIISCTEAGGWQISLDSQSGDQRDYVRLCFYVNGSYKWVYVERNTLSSGWHMFTGVYDGTKAYLYIDGTFANSTDASGGITYGNTTLCFGAEPSGISSVDGSYFNGKIADAKIYATVLSASDILALYQGRAELDNRLGLYGANFIEEDRPYELTKKSVFFAEEFNEEPGNFKWEDKDSYHELEYIESTGTQYINTGVIPTTDTKIDIDFTYLGSSYSAWSPIYGERGSSNSTYFNLFINTTSKQISPNYAGFDPGSSSTIYFTPGARYHVVTDKGQFYLNDELVSSLSTSNTLTTSTVNMYLFALGVTSGVDNRSMRARIYSCRFYEGDTLIRNFIPVRWDATGEIGLYDTVEKKFYTNDGTGEFIAGENRYQRLEYIQSTGTQYIDTGYYHHTAKTIYKWGMMIKGLPASSVVYHSPFGARTSHDSPDAYYMGINHTDMHCYGCIGGYKQDPFSPNLILSNDVYYEGKMDYASGLYINGNCYSMPGREGRLSPFSCYVFAGNWNGTADEFFWGRIYYLKIYDIGTLVRDFIPVRDKKTGEVGLFDKVSSTFYANQGSGDFIAGPEARYEELEYIESSGTQYIDTGIIPDYNIKISGEFMHTEHIIDTPLFGARTNGYVNSYTFWAHPSDYTPSPYNTLLFNDTTVAFTDDGLPSFTKEKFYYSNNKIICNGIEKTISPAQQGSPSLSLILFGLRTGNVIDDRRFIGRVYWFKIYNSNKLVRDFIPVKNSETGEVGLFDKVESIFYTNQGVGSFIAGPEANNLEINKGRWVIGQLIED